VALNKTPLGMSTRRLWATIGTCAYASYGQGFPRSHQHFVQARPFLLPSHAHANRLSHLAEPQLSRLAKSLHRQF